MSTDVDITVKGHMIYCKNQYGELYQFFSPIDKKYMTLKDAQMLTDLRHKVLSVERHNVQFKVNYYDLKKIAQPTETEK